MDRPRVGIFGLTGCAGDQLQILNCEEELVRLSERLDLVDWVMARSRSDRSCRLEVGFVEGVVATERDLEALKEIRARARTLVALGTCAVWGGLPALRNQVPRGVLDREAHAGHGEPLGAAEALPPSHFVHFDLLVPGCPIERHEFLAVVNALLVGTRPELPTVPVCWDCKTRENLCRVLHFGEICCGAMTRGGCGARCPSHGVACAGCRGPVEEPNYDANITMFADRGISWVEIARKMSHFSTPVWMTHGLEQEVRRERSR